MKDTPTMTEVIENIVNRSLLDLHTAMPGIIQSYDPDKKTASVRPAIKRQFKDARPDQELNIITDVPIAFLQTNTFIFTIPLKKGDEVLLIFSERSLDKWLNSGKLDSRIVNPEDPRKFSLSDAIAIPILKPIETGKKADPDNVFIEHYGNTLTISPKGNFTYTNEAGGRLNLDETGRYSIGNKNEELLSILSELIELILAAVTNTMIGPQPFVNLADFAALKSRLDSQLKQ